VNEIVINEELISSMKPKMLSSN